MSTTAYPHNAYRSNAVLTAAPGQLVVILYDGARRFLYQASTAMAERQIEAAHLKLTRAENIIRHLRSVLDMSQGELSLRLESIYLFSLDHLRRARLEQDAGKVDEVNELLGKLRDSWATIAEQ
jgi:flagellar protein FliS